LFFLWKNKSVGICTAIMAIARRSCCDCTAFTLRLLAICGRLYRVLSDSTTFSRRSYYDLSVFIACSNDDRNEQHFYQHLYHGSKEG
jgi:hypothetical protein